MLDTYSDTYVMRAHVVREMRSCAALRVRTYGKYAQSLPDAYHTHMPTCVNGAYVHAGIRTAWTATLNVDAVRAVRAVHK
jgi:hypothetical protein